MNSAQIWGLVIASIAVTGGMVIALAVVKIVLPPHYQERLTALENQSRERLALIEKGMDPSLVFKKDTKASDDPLFWGLLLVGVGWGAFTGSFINGGYAATINSLATFGGGLGLVIYYMIRRWTDRKKAR